MNIFSTKASLRLILPFLLLSIFTPIHSQPTGANAPTTLRPLLQQLGHKLLQGKQGSIVALEPTTGRILCLVTNSPSGENTGLAIATAYAPGSTIKTANALTFLSEGIITPDTRIACHNAFRQGNIRVGCHAHRSPVNVVSALAISCNTFFLTSFLAMMNDRFIYENQDEAISTWNAYLTSMGLGGPLGVDISGEKGGLLANVAYLNRRYKNGWDPLTIFWVGMGQGDVTLTPLQMANLAASIANRGYWFTPHIHALSPTDENYSRYTTKHLTKVQPEAYATVIAGMRQAVVSGTAHAINASYPICGKTGTIENGGKDHGAFIGFAPMNNPRIALAVYIEHSGFGADMAAPIGALIIEEYLKGKLSPASLARANRLAAKHLFK